MKIIIFYSLLSIYTAGLLYKREMSYLKLSLLHVKNSLVLIILIFLFGLSVGIYSRLMDAFLIQSIAPSRKPSPSIKIIISSSGIASIALK